MIKKLFYISSALLLLVLFFLAVYNFAFRPKNIESADISIESAIGILGGEKKMKPGTIDEIADFPVIGATLGADNSSIIFFGRENSKLYRYSLTTGNKKTILQRNIPSLGSVAWSSSKKTALVSSASESEKYFVLDTVTGAANPLFTTADAATWMSIGERIAFKKFDTQTNTRGIYISDIAGRDEKKIADVNFRYLELEKIPETSLVSFWNTPNAGQETELFVVSAVNQQPNKIVGGIFGADYLWSPTGTQVLISHTDRQGGSRITLALADDRGGNYQNLEIPTFVSKCAWSPDGKTVYYALPESLPENAQLPDDYQSGKIRTIDTIWKLNVISGRRDRLVDFKRMNKEFDVTNLFVTAGGDKLVFTNRINERLYLLQLPE